MRRTDRWCLWLVDIEPSELKQSPSIRKSIIAAGRTVLAGRANHPGQSLADLYDPLTMPPDLRRAHERLDKVVNPAFGADKWLKNDDEARLRVLFAGYARMTA